MRRPRPTSGLLRVRGAVLRCTSARRRDRGVARGGATAGERDHPACTKPKARKVGDTSAGRGRRPAHPSPRQGWSPSERRHSAATSKQKQAATRPRRPARAVERRRRRACAKPAGAPARARDRAWPSDALRRCQVMISGKLHWRWLDAREPRRRSALSRSVPGECPSVTYRSRLRELGGHTTRGPG
jgi:hypothetical protein